MESEMPIWNKKKKQHSESSNIYKSDKYPYVLENMKYHHTSDNQQSFKDKPQTDYQEYIYNSTYCGTIGAFLVQYLLKKHILDTCILYIIIHFLFFRLLPCTAVTKIREV